MYFISYFLIKGRYHYGAGVNTDKREDRQKEKENIRGEERKLLYSSRNILFHHAIAATNNQ